MTDRYIYYLVTGERAPRRAPRRRRGPARDSKYLAWIRTLACVACGIERDIQAAHTEHNGMASKGSDYSCVPLCVPCHRAYDSGLRSKALFEKDHNIEMAQVVKRLNQEWSL